MYIPKKVADRFNKAVPKFQKVLQIAKDRDVNESDTVSIINDILSDVFGYDKYMEVTSEFAIRGTYCDLAIKIDEKVQFLIEVKAIGIELKESHMRQALNYGANNGVQWVVLTNGAEWRLYRLRFEKPMNYDLVFSFEFLELKPRDARDTESLFLLSKEGLVKNIRDEYYERVQSVNKYIIASLVMGDRVTAVLRKELRKFAEGVKVELEEVQDILKNEVLKRELIEGEKAEAAQSKVDRFYKKSSPRRRGNGTKGGRKEPSVAEDASIDDGEEEKM